MGRVSYDRLEGEEAEKLDVLFGMENCLIEVNPGKVILPPQFQEIGDAIVNLEVRPDDIWLVSYPRTGSTWTQEMVWLIGNDLDYEGAKQLQPIRAPLLELSAVMARDHPDFIDQVGNSVVAVQNMPSPRYIKTHLPWELLPDQISQVKPKIVYVARNPKDMCVSYYHYCLLVHNMKEDFETFCQLFLKGMAPVGPIWNHILGFWKRRDDPNILFLKYEDMKKNQVEAIHKAAAFLGKTLSDEQVKKLQEHLSFNKMKENKAVNLEAVIEQAPGAEHMHRDGLKFIRKGQVGDYKNHMTPELIAQFDQWTEENLRGTGLSFE